jgi:hypothetical protein
VAAPLTDPAGTTLVFHNDRDNSQWLAGIAPVGDTGWRVVAVQPERAALRVLRQMLWPMGLVVGVLGVLLFGISLRWAKVQQSSLLLLRQNTKILRQLQQRKTLGPGSGTGPGPKP